MTRYRNAVLLLLIQLVLILSISAKYLYERHTCPRIWVRSAPYDPNMPLRGRYLALSPLINACRLAHDSDSRRPTERNASYSMWDVTLSVENGNLVPVLADRSTRSGTMRIMLWNKAACDRATLSPASDFFIPDNARPPFPLQAGQELWIEVTVPPHGLPRPIQLALSSKAGFQPLTF